MSAKWSDTRIRAEVWIQLTEEDMMAGAHLGGVRALRSMQKGRQDRHGVRETKNDVLGALGELAVARWAEIPFEPRIDTFKGPDLGAYTQVRTTSLPDLNFWLTESDAPEQYYVYVLYQPPDRFGIVGGCTGQQGFRVGRWEQNQRGPRQSCWVPWGQLDSLLDVELHLNRERSP